MHVLTVMIFRGQLETGCTFVIDKRGDLDNLKYGELERSTVPEYHRSGGKYTNLMISGSS